MKRVASIQDISCLGRCSLTVALPVLSAMAVECAVIPTAVLSTHTEFPDFVSCDLTDHILPVAQHWKSQKVSLPILYVGIFSSGVGYTLQILAQKDSNPTVVTLLLSMESVFAVIAGAVLLHQQMSSREYFGCVLMMVAVILAQIPFPEKRKTVKR